MNEKPTYEPFDLGPPPRISDEQIEHRWDLVESFFRLQGFPYETMKEIRQIFEQAKEPPHD